MKEKKIKMWGLYREDSGVVSAFLSRESAEEEAVHQFRDYKIIPIEVTYKDA